MLIRDECGKVFNKVNTPAVVFDKESGVYHKVGEYDILKDYYDLAVKAYRTQGFPEMARNLVLLELPKDQEVIDKVFQNSGYIKTYYENEVLDKT